MGWSIGFDGNWNRDIGYGVPCVCDHPDCKAEIDRGLSHVCGSDPYGGEFGCGLYFCGTHLYFRENDDEEARPIQVCDRCYDGKEAFAPKPDVPEWTHWKMTDESWAKWREDNPEIVRDYRKNLEKEKNSEN